jgi:branched-chain amino acid transport system substrate-binding protein
MFSISSRRSVGSIGTATLVAASITIAAAAAPAGASGGSDPSGDPIRVGVSLSLTGDFSDNGEAAELGYRLWEKDMNAAGGLLGRPIEILIVDDASDTQQVVTNYENFITRENVDLVFGPYSSLLNIPAGQVAARYGYAFIEAMGNGPSVFEECLPTLIYAGTAASDTAAEGWSDYILSLPEEDRPETAAYVSLDDPFSAPAAEHVRVIFEEAGIETVYSETYAESTTDLTPIMRNVQNEDPDMVVSGTQTADGFAQVRAMVQLDFSPEFLFMTNGPVHPVDFPENVGPENTEGIFTIDNWAPELDTVGNAEFVASYIEEYGGEIDNINSTSAQAYAVGQLTQLLVEHVGEIDQEALVETSRTESFDTIVGTVELGDCGAPSGSYPLFQWVDGNITIVWPSDLALAEPIYPKPDWGAAG